MRTLSRKRTRRQKTILRRLLLADVLLIGALVFVPPFIASFT